MMKRIAAVLTLCLVVTAPAWAAFYSFEQLTVAATAVPFTATKITPANLTPMTIAQCRLETAQIRYSYDGTTPTSSVGILWEVGEYITFTQREDILNFKAIRTTSTSGQLDCTYKTP